MKQTTYDVFISYSRKDYVDKEGKEIPGNVISIIKETLKKHGISYWMDEEGNLTAKKFASIIAGKIRESMAFLFVCSKNSVASRWVERELSVADTYEKHIIPFVCDDSYKDDKVIMYTAAVNRIEYFSNPERALNKLVSVIEGDKKGLEQKLLKEEIKWLVDDYQVRSTQQEMIVQQLISKNVNLGLKSKRCPVCDNTVLLNKSYCDKCGWQFPSLYSLDGREISVCDEMQLTLARDHWHSLDNVVLLQQDLKRKEEEVEKEKRKNAELIEQNEALERRQKEIMEKMREADLEKVKSQIVSDSAQQDLIIPVNSLSIVMKPVEGGTFWMGAQKTDPKGQNYDDEADDNESPVHSVKLDSFYMGETVVTQVLWKAVMGGNPSCFKGDTLPVEGVSWNDCQKFINELNRQTGKNFRLPTEAEREYAAIGGQKCNIRSKYSGSNAINKVAWYSGNSNGKTYPVKEWPPNGLGLYDMSGNVWEWCED